MQSTYANVISFDPKKGIFSDILAVGACSHSYPPPRRGTAERPRQSAGCWPTTAATRRRRRRGSLCGTPSGAVRSVAAPEAEASGEGHDKGS
jgi:hypothetical protein